MVAYIHTHIHMSSHTCMDSHTHACIGIPPTTCMSSSPHNTYMSFLSYEYTHTHIYGLTHIWVPMYTHIVKAKFFLVETKALVGKETAKPQTPVWEVLWHNQG